jgi:hypothetical protein
LKNHLGNKAFREDKSHLVGDKKEEVYSVGEWFLEKKTFAITRTLDIEKLRKSNSNARQGFDELLS